jgi:hypothetical protein
MNIPQGSFWVYQGQPGRGQVHRVTGVIKHMPVEDKWKLPEIEFLPPKFGNFTGPDTTIEIATWSVTPMMDIPMGMDSGTAGFSWLGPLKDFCANFEPYQ